MRTTPSLRLLVLALAAAAARPAAAQAALNDLEMAHVAVTASNIDIAYAKLALEKSKDAGVRGFAETMIRDHTAVNDQVVALAKKLGVTAQDNAVSRKLSADATRKQEELGHLKGGAFDAAYLSNELAYHQAVNSLVSQQFIPGAKNAEVKAAFETALPIFKAHEQHVAELVKKRGAAK